MTATPRPARSLARRVLPWLFAAALLTFLITRVPFAAFRDAVTHGPHLVLASVDFGVNLVVLCTDTLAVLIGLVALNMRRPFRKVFVVRGATNLLTLVNYALAQGAFGYYLHKTGAKALHSVGATLFLMGTNFAALLVLTAITWEVQGAAGDSRLWWTLLAGCGGFLIYLAVIALSPGFIRRREVFEPLFGAGVRGHLLAVAGRVPHVITLVMGQWLALRAWNVPVPFWYGITTLPIVLIATVLPISPAGLGTSQAAFVYFYANYASGATSDSRNAAILAFSIVHFVYAWLSSIAIGLLCMPSAKRSLEQPAPAST